MMLTTLLLALSTEHVALQFFHPTMKDGDFLFRIVWRLANFALRQTEHRSRKPAVVCASMSIPTMRREPMKSCAKSLKIVGCYLSTKSGFEMNSGPFSGQIPQERCWLPLMAIGISKISSSLIVDRQTLSLRRREVRAAPSFVAGVLS